MASHVPLWHGIEVKCRDELGRHCRDSSFKMNIRHFICGRSGHGLGGGGLSGGVTVPKQFDVPVSKGSAQPMPGICLAFAAVMLTCAGADVQPLAGEAVPAELSSGVSQVPAPLPGNPGNIFLEGQEVKIPIPKELMKGHVQWRLFDDRGEVVRSGGLGWVRGRDSTGIELGALGVGWYRLEFGQAEFPGKNLTTIGVLRELRVPVPADSPVALDSAAAWFARSDVAKQEQLANLAALAGVSWVRDRLRWRDIQPQRGELARLPTTYDTSAAAHVEAGLRVLQVFHDTPPWAREGGSSSGQFAPDLRDVYLFGRRLAERFKGRVAAWEPWNEANVGSFGGHTVDQMCSWQKASWLGFKNVDPDLIVGWNATAAVPTPAHTEGVLANETWPYFDSYNIHTYDWAHAYAELWGPAREAASGRPIWVTEADRGTPHIGNAPWFDQDARLERLKAEWIAQAYASSLFSGARYHFHFILGNYQEPNGIQFGLLRLDLTPRPAYVALAAVGRCLAGARALGRWRPGGDVNVYAFRARPDGKECDVLVAWAEKEVDWDGRGVTAADWELPLDVNVIGVVDYLGRPLETTLPGHLTSAPLFVFLPVGQAETLPLEKPPIQSAWRGGAASPVVLQLSLPRSAVREVKDLPWSEGYAYRATPGQAVELPLRIYNFAASQAAGRLEIERHPPGWEVRLSSREFELAALGRAEAAGWLFIPEGVERRDGWVVVRAECGQHGRPVLAFRVLVSGAGADSEP
jgi:hypothetical protein